MTSDLTKRPVRPRHPSVLAWLRLARVFQKIDNASARHFQSWKLSSRKLSTAQFDVLAQVGAAQGITQQELAGALFVIKGSGWRSSKTPA